MRLVGRQELITDERFVDAAAVVANAAEGRAILTEVFAERTADEWRDLLQSFSGQWAMVQSTLEVADDPQAIANGYVQQYESAEGLEYRLAAPPVRFDDDPPTPLRAPEFNEHGDEILTGIGLDWDRIIDLKVRGVVA